MRQNCLSWKPHQTHRINRRGGDRDPNRGSLDRMPVSYPLDDRLVQIGRTGKMQSFTITDLRPKLAPFDAEHRCLGGRVVTPP
jgi:hypothetical protein